MKKNLVHCFTSNYCVIIPVRDNTELEEYRSRPNCIVNPNTKRVSGVKMQFRKLVDGEVVPMTDAEMKDRQEHIDRYGLDKKVQRIDKKNIHSYKVWRRPLHYAAAFTLGAMAGAAILQLILKGGF